MRCCHVLAADQNGDEGTMMPENLACGASELYVMAAGPYVWSHLSMTCGLLSWAVGEEERGALMLGWMLR